MEALPSKKLQPWQLDPQSLQGDKIQLWLFGQLMGHVTLSTARNLIKRGGWHCASSEAIEDGGFYA